MDQCPLVVAYWGLLLKLQAAEMAVFSVGLSSLAVDVLTFLDFGGFFPALYSHPMMDVKDFFLSTWNKSAISFCKAINLVHMHLWT